MAIRTLHGSGHRRGILAPSITVVTRTSHPIPPWALPGDALSVFPRSPSVQLCPPWQPLGVPCPKSFLGSGISASPRSLWAALFLTLRPGGSTEARGAPDSLCPSSRGRGRPRGCLGEGCGRCVGAVRGGLWEARPWACRPGTALLSGFAVPPKPHRCAHRSWHLSLHHTCRQPGAGVPLLRSPGERGGSFPGGDLPPHALCTTHARPPGQRQARDQAVLPRAAVPDAPLSAMRGRPHRPAVPQPRLTWGSCPSSSTASSLRPARSPSALHLGSQDSPLAFSWLLA